MKYKLYLIGVLLFFICSATFGENETDNGTKDQTSQNNTLSIQCSPELYPLVTNWSNECSSLNPSLNIIVDPISDLSIQDNQNISFISGDINNSAEWSMVVGHDAVVPVMNAKNPLLKEVYLKGVSVKGFALLFNGTKELNWASILEGAQNKSLNYYLYDDASVIAGIAKFLKTDPNAINGNTVATPKELLSAVQQDVYAIGFCKLKDIRKANSNEWVENIVPLPIDKNANGRIDHFENIYSNPDALARGVWIGKYPSTLCGNIYAVSANKPANENAIQFLTWILSDGGQYLNANGYSYLVSAERQANIDLLTNNDTGLAQADAEKASNGLVLILIGLAVTGLILAYVLRKLATAKSTSKTSNIHFTPVLNENLIEAPKGLYYDKTHTWTFMEQDGMVKIGIDDFLPHITGDITRIIMRNPGETVRKGEKILTIVRLGKQLNIYSPVTGTIRVQNPELLSNSQFINSSPFLEGWVYLVEPANWLREIQFMFMADSYKEWLKEEFIRLKDFFSVTVKSYTYAYEQIVLQDGGELQDKILADMKPEVWEDFQTKFIDTSK